MRRFVFILLILAAPCYAQLSITPVAGISIKGMTQSIGIQNGGSAFFGGAEIEYGWKRFDSRVHMTVMSGVSYLDIDFSNTNNLSVADFFYWHYTTSTNTEYLRIPLMLKLNWQPSPLLEQWIVFFGFGATANVLMKSTIAEETTIVAYNDGSTFRPPPTIEQYEDSRDVTSLSESMYLFSRVELGMRLKKIHFSFRISKSYKDMYLKGLENTWAVPQDESLYMRSYRQNGKIKERYVELTFGYVIWPGKRVKQQFR